MDSAESENLFSYGTLQMETVQLSTFGRALKGNPDTLPGYRLDLLEITDKGVIASSGLNHHPIIKFTGDQDNTIDGTCFQITKQELLQADAYEVADYKRISVQLQSGKQAWVYIDVNEP